MRALHIFSAAAIALFIGQCAHSSKVAATKPITNTNQIANSSREMNVPQIANTKWYGYYSHNKLDSASAALDEYFKKYPTDYTAMCYYAETLRRLKRESEADSIARAILSKQPRNIFALNIRGDVFNTQYSDYSRRNDDSAGVYYTMAVRCDSADGDAWEKLWIKGWQSGDTVLANAALSRLYQSSFYTPKSQAFARWCLRSLPANAVLFTSGDMDTYPFLSVQQSEGVRSDVAIVNITLLNIPQYFAYVTTHNRLPKILVKGELEAFYRKPANDDTTKYPFQKVLAKIFDSARKKSMNRPLCVSLMANDAYYQEYKFQLCVQGPYFRYLAEGAQCISNADTMMNNLKLLHAEDFRGPVVGPSVRSPVMLNADQHGFDFVFFYIAYTALNEFIGKNRLQDALDVLQWLEQFGSKIDSPQDLMDRIGRSRQMIMESIERSKKSASEGAH
jgi:hypothetical protein